MADPIKPATETSSGNLSASSRAWRPLRNRYFRMLLWADFVSDVGSFFQAVGAAWLMTTLTPSPLYVALIQTASALPFFLLSLPAGTMGDIIDRRKLILGTETWMLAAAIVLAVAALTGGMTPWLLLLMTLALSAGDAVESPAWRATFPELVDREDLPAALTLNGVEFNLARAVGPGLAGVVVSLLGVGIAFVLNAISFLGVILVVVGWKRSKRQSSLPQEGFVGGTTAAIRYVRYSPGIRTLLWRAGVLIFFVSAFWALLPNAAKALSSSPVAYGLLLGFFGAGAVAGAFVLQRARGRFSAEVTLAIATTVFAAVLLGTAMLRTLPLLCVLMICGGASWTVLMSLFNIIAQALAPDWVRARVLAFYLFVYQGSVTLGSTLWGLVALHVGAHRGLAAAGIGTVACLGLQPLLRLPDASVDLSSWNHWLRPAMFEQPDPEDGPVLVTVTYLIDPAKEAAFLQDIYEYERIRRRDGAQRWGVWADTESRNTYLETFVVDSWGEHERQHARFTHADREIESRLQSYTIKATVAKHYIAPSRND